jgi:hypothetical protein
VAKTATDIPITQGAGVNLSNFVLANGRRRQTVVLGDADATGEALVAELPAHGSPDRGSSLKIGGRAAVYPDDLVDANDRADAWFSLGGQLGVIVTQEPGTVYDGGRRIVQFASVATLGINNTTAQFVPAPGAGLKIKVLSVSIQCVIFGTAGSLGLFGGTGMNYWIAQITALGQGAFTAASPNLHFATALNTALSISYTGNATFNASLVYYTAP